MKLSIITVTYNPGNSLISTLHSIEKQKEYEIELLIIDGGSTDNTINIANSYKNKFSSVIVVSEPDNGIYDAMNKGIDLAKGDYLFFLNAGDVFFDENVLKNVLPLLNGNDVFYGDSYVYDENHVLNPFRSGRFSRYRLSYTNICHQSIFYPKYLLSSCKFNLRYCILADWYTNMVIWNKHPFIYIKKPVVIYENGGISDLRRDMNFIKDHKINVLKILGVNAFIFLCVRRLLERITTVDKLPS